MKKSALLTLFFLITTTLLSCGKEELKTHTKKINFIYNSNKNTCLTFSFSSTNPLLLKIHTEDFDDESKRRNLEEKGDLKIVDSCPAHFKYVCSDVDLSKTPFTSIELNKIPENIEMKMSLSFPEVANLVGLRNLCSTEFGGNLIDIE